MWTEYRPARTGVGAGLQPGDPVTVSATGQVGRAPETARVVGRVLSVEHRDGESRATIRVESDEPLRIDAGGGVSVGFHMGWEER